MKKFFRHLDTVDTLKFEKFLCLDTVDTLKFEKFLCLDTVDTLNFLELDTVLFLPDISISHQKIYVK